MRKLNQEQAKNKKVKNTRIEIHKIQNKNQ